MDVKKFSSSGWILSESGLKLLQLNDTVKFDLKTLINKDLREIGAGCSEFHKGKLENVDYELIVLQIMKIRNVSAPKANENSKTAPKLLKLQLTDGQNTYSAIEMEPTALTFENTPPGTKISLKVKQLKIANGQLLLTPKNMEILGGNVESLVSKWEISRSLANQMRGNRSAGAPPFIPFGQKIQQNITNDKSFKSLHVKQKENDDNSEFNTQRQDAIAEASKVAAKKTFGGGTKILVDTNVQKIMDKGFTEEQATTALKFARNNVEKALGNLKRREERQQQRGSSIDYDSRENPRERRGDRESRGNSKGAASSELQQAKPSTGVSLFDFLENKIPESNAVKQSYSYSHNDRFENNISSSFRKYDKDSSDKSHQWSQYSTPSEQKSSQNFTKNSAHSTRNDYYGNEGSSTREHKDYKGNSNNYRSERSERDNTKQQYYQKPGGNNNNYPAKTNSAASSTHYSKNNLTTTTSTQKSSNHYNSGASSYNNNNNNNNNSGHRYGQKSADHVNSRPSKDYNNSYSSSAASSSYHSKGRSNTTNNDAYHSKTSSRNIVDSMEKMNLKGNQHYKGYDQALSSSETSSNKQQSYSTNYPTIGFQSKEGNEQAKTALKTKNFPVPNHQNQNWQQQQQQQQSIPPPFQNAVQPFVQHPVMAMQTATVFQPITYPPITIMQTVPSHMQAPPALIPPLKINDYCLAKYWEDGKFYNAKITGGSESTFVVHFTEYGNAEEVRKTDCVPVIVPTCPTPPQPSYHQVATPAVPPSHMGSYPQKIGQQHNYHGQQPMPYKGGPKRRN